MEALETDSGVPGDIHRVEALEYESGVLGDNRVEVLETDSGVRKWSTRRK